METIFKRIEQINNPLSIPSNIDLKEYVKTLNQPFINRNYDKKNDLNQYVGWSQQVPYNPFIQEIFSDRTIQMIRAKTSQYLIGVMPGKTIIPSENVVKDALNTVFTNYIPNTGDIYGKFLVVDESTRNDYSAIVDQTISMLVQGITEQISVDNQEYNVWDARILGDFNAQGVRRHDVIKLRERRPTPMLFNMKY